jgi:hypothetical protein
MSANRQIVVPERNAELAQSTLGCGIAGGIGFMATAVVGAVLVWQTTADVHDTYIPLLVLSAAGFIGASVLFSSVRNRVARQRLNALGFEIVPRGGEGVEVNVSFTPNATVKLDAITVTIRGLAFDRNEINNSKNTLAFSEERVLAQDESASGGNRASYSTFFALPDDAPLTESPDGSGVSGAWLVDLHVAVDGWPDHIETRRFELLQVTHDAEDGAVGDEVVFDTESAQENDEAVSQPVDPSGMW